MPDLCDVSIVGAVCGAAGDVVASAGNSALDSIAQGMADGAAWTTKTVLTWWTEIPLPAPDGAVEVFVRNSTTILAATGLVSAVIIGAAKMLWTRRADEGRNLANALTVNVLATAGAVPVILTLAQTGDLLSSWIINRAAGGDLGARMIGLINFSNPTLYGASSSILLLLAFFAALAGLAQVFALLIKGAVLPILVGLIPASTSLLNTNFGRQWAVKTTAWIAAFLLYKPIASLIYGAAFVGFGNGQDTTQFISGILLLVAAAFVLPALVRVISPVASAAARGAAGAGLGGALVTAGATGARLWASGADSRGGKGGQGKNGQDGGNSPGLRGPSGAGRTGKLSPPAGPTGPAGAGGGGGAGVKAGAAGTGAAGARAAGAAGAAGGAGATGAAGAAGATAGPAGMAATTVASGVAEGARRTKQGLNNATEKSL